MNYPYANGVIATIDESLFDAKKLAKLENLSKQGFIKALSDMNYGKGGNSIEGLIENEMVSVKELIDSISPDKDLSDLFFLFHDVTIIKAYLKMKYFNISKRDFSQTIGNLSNESLKSAVFENDYNSLPKDYQKLLTIINESIDKLVNDKELNAREFSAAIDKAVFKFIKIKLRFSRQIALTTYFKAYVDFRNLLSFVRSIRLGWSIDKFGEMFIDFGKIPYTVYSSVYSHENTMVVRALEDYYSGRLSKVLIKYFENSDLDILERSFDELMIELMKEFKHDSFSIGPMIYYYLIKEAEAKNIKLLYAGGNVDLGSLIEY
jgi:vacuolar-type H+-ATPase subunit C/Vma6